MRATLTHTASTFHWEVVPLSAACAALQGLDAYSTLRAIRNGSLEGNPVVAPFARHPVAFVALKAGMSGALWYSTTKLSHRNRLAAILVLVGADVAMSLVVAHNYRIGASQKLTADS